MTVTVELSKELERRLDELALRSGRSRDDIVRDAVAAGLEDIEDYFDALAVSQRVRDGKESTFSSAEIRRDLGMDD